MIALGWRLTLHDPRSIVGVAVICAASTLGLTLVATAALLESAADPKGQGAFGSIVAFTLLALIVSVWSTSSLAARMSRRVFASWLVVGLTPRQVCRLLLTRALLGGGIGALLGLPAAGVLVGPVMSAYASAGFLPTSPSRDDVLRVAQVAMPATAVVVVALTCIATLPSALSAARTNPAHTLRESDARVRASPLVRGLVAGGLLTLTLPPLVGALVLDAGLVGPAGLGGTFGLTPAHRVIALEASVSLWLVIATAIVMPAGARRLILLWTAVVPARWSACWFLARHAAAERVAATAATVTVGGLVIGLVGSVQGAADTARLLGTSSGSSWAELVSTLGPSAGVALVGSGVALTIGRAAEVDDHHLLDHLGLTTRRRLRVEMLKIAVYSVTALLPAIGVSLLSVTSAALIAPALGASVSAVVPDARPMLAAAALVTLTCSVATFAPLLGRGRSNPISSMLRIT